MMRIFLWLVFGLFVLKATVASPRFSRQVDYDSYDEYDKGEDNFDENNYDYEPEIVTLEESENNYPEPDEVVKTEEEEEQEKEEEELPLKPQAVPQGSGGSGVLMGPDTEKEVELRQATVDTLHVSGDFGGSVGSGETSAISGASGSGISGDILVSYEVFSGSGDLSDDILVSGYPEEFLKSSGSGEFLTAGDLLISGDVSGSGVIIGSAISGASGDSLSEDYKIVTKLPIGSGGSGDQSGSGFSVDLLSSGASGISGVSEGSIESGYSGITLISGEEEFVVIVDKVPEEALSASGLLSGDTEASVDSEVSGTSGFPSVSGSGDIDVTIRPVEPEEEEELFPTTLEPPQEGKTSLDEETGGSGFPKPEEPEEPDEVIKKGLPVCLLCTCLGGSVYCDDLKLDSVPPLPKDITHFYARYNRITKISKSDFANMNKLKKIDLTANKIISIEDRTFMGLPELEEVIIRENQISQLPALPETMILIDASHNNIGSKGIHKEAFKDMTGLLYLYLTDNNIDYIPVPLPDSLRSLHLQRNNIQMMHEDTFCNLNDFNYIRNALEDIRLDGNPINLSKTPQAYICLPRIPIGNLI